ncbi:hypothetical protein DXN05_20900 [Deminuibacter soli]|uniref:Uncharacterized protein n=1 Tax=Deminuibacter soli TaxID=2291815 RepID=A0A3E1NEG4_9BACT|nr:hypothetical protein DXN05_20900 [Deminuibacter soli]
MAHAYCNAVYAVYRQGIAQLCACSQCIAIPVLLRKMDENFRREVNAVTVRNLAGLDDMCVLFQHI